MSKRKIVKAIIIIGLLGAGHVSGKLLDASDIDRLAKMPTKEQAISMLMSVMKAPVDKFVRTLAEPHAKLVRTVAAVRDQKKAAA